jgi:secreted trypsin-like serine protease
MELRSDGRVYQIGITSHGCNNFLLRDYQISNPVLYVKISKYMDWIESNINKYGLDSKVEKILTEC